MRRSRYFGNTAPLLVAACLLPLVTTQVSTQPVLWALPFLLTFVGGVFADAFETKARRQYLLLACGAIAAQVALLLTVLPRMHR